MSRRKSSGSGELAVMAWTAIAAMGALAGLPAPAPAASSVLPPDRYEEKAAVVLALARYVEWPSSAPAGSPFVVGVLGDALQTSGIPSLSLWARLPHYVQETPNSRAALALLQRVESITGFPFDKSALEPAAASFDQEVSEAIAADPQLSAYVRELKRRAFSQ